VSHVSVDRCVCCVCAELPLNESLSEAEVKAKNYYISCLDVDQTVENLGAQPLLDLMHKQFSSWTANWEAAEWNFQDTVEKIHVLGISSFFSFWVSEDEKEPTKNILQVIFIIIFMVVDGQYVIKAVQCLPTPM